MSDDLRDALSALEAAVSTPVKKAAPRPVSVERTVERDSDGRISKVIAVREDGRVFHSVPYRDSEERVVRTVTEEQAPPRPFEIAGSLTFDELDALVDGDLYLLPDGTEITRDEARAILQDTPDERRERLTRRRRP